MAFRPRLTSYLMAVAVGGCLCASMLANEPRRNQAPTLRRQADDQTIKFAKEAVDSNPESPQARLQLGAAYARARRFEEAIESFTHAIQLRPDYEAAHLQRG